MGALTLMTVEWGVAASFLAAIIFSATVGVSFGRRWLVSKKLDWASGFEIVLNALVVGVAAWIVGHHHLGPGLVLLSVPFSERRLAVIAITASVFIFAGQGGTHVVRGILDRVGTLPRTRDTRRVGAGPVDTEEYNRGRVIGNLERYVLLLTVVLDTYAALGFLIAAKGFIRIEELKDRAFAEYFLIGTLSSVGLAVLLGLLLRWAMLTLW